MTDPAHITVSGAPEGFDATRILAELDRGVPVCHVARDDKRLVAMRDALRFFAPDVPVVVFPAWDCLPYDRVSPNADISAQRMATLAALAHGMPDKFVLLTTLNAATQKLPARSVLREAAFAARVGDRIDDAALRGFLVRMGFVQSPTVTEPGDYAVRGGIIDIYPPGDLGPVRLDLFGDVLDGARRFDPATQRTTEKLDVIELAPVSEVILDEAAVTRFRQNYRLEFGAAGTDDPLYEAISAGRKHQGAEHWLSFFHDHLETLFDYLPDAAITLDDQVTPTRLARWDTIADQYETRRLAMLNRSKMDTVYKPAPPQGLYLDDAAWEAAVKGRRVVQFRALAQSTGLGVVDAGGRIGRNFSPERQQENISLFGALAAHIKAKLADSPVVVASYSAGARERLSGLIEDEGLAETIPITDATRIGKRGLHLVVWALEHGFEGPVGDKHLTVISEQDVLGDRLIRQPKRKRRADNFLTEATSLTPGDLIVHVDHGIGRYHGMEVITAAGAAHECLLLEYAENSKLYLPVENIELLSKYGHDEGLLDRLGGGAWQSKKAKLKERIREMADKLIRIAAERALRRAPVLEPPPGMWDAFSARFPYEETDDQLKAIGDVIQDLTSGAPMDRLVVGDVGFGKTEVAMRAAFVAAMAGVQVAVIAPTTLLARQHYKSFSERFRGFPIEVRTLSRFVSAKEASDAREAMSRGTADIVIGTHALLAKNTRFKDLGLLIIDEEQHFGVGHKERLKQMRSDVHVLTLTATPIPRTLQLSLTGVRDLSIIGTPPVDRLAIRTYVSEFDTVTIREALLREHYRGGQSFYVVPRLSDLPEIEEFLKAQLPELTYVVAHGQMAAGELDDRMNAFYDGKFDILLATTIVESGLDIPTANTMVVHRADMFGLAQLYQIRGRVGRSKTRAYAYLTTKPRAKLTAVAEKRLRVLGSLDTLGAGFTLASQDLDIRGAGNLLGEEQSGQMRDVGFELYQSMLEEAIAKIKAGELEGLSEADEQWAPQINLGVPVLIPEDYVPDLDVRLGLYRRLSGLSTKVELEGFAAELIDRFGTLPREVNTLMLVVRIKAMCKRAGISKLDGGPKGAVIQFHNDKFASPEGLVTFIQDQRGLAKVKDNKIVVRRDWKSDADKIKGAFAIARDLAEKVVGEKKKAKAKA
ncbi:transcription-repair coupling factor [Pseudosulfitobacter pseudonitzschiae]|uniref:transcription-repair coupling factor n=1 Tax=Pseudosulfitobacter pseudonitzschiae TaxID=1402135 RepID=UPI001AF74C78|nr:transcription-repair coupling factor [Pseudosulfitobacter pseudonitzschiae]MBM1817079.1 transcription-repair coupling factor [Pseudosulfitobacter pseudonitzschiae]MBM1834082.1 transcription-repair coupling factor [Pseudosulfitobacter pseudonitzschiae]MBM1838948.1 transcription-repair coupling factor [Pseudosulfitobacter pseudonitzschiae]MBM1843797.1 transcription-repair coupling factor [Pseudosulfitobacter pseudonitzschiae]MBM1848644.1 transcription-repair coupling factor [Pseudosulfitobact